MLDRLKLATGVLAATAGGISAVSADFLFVALVVAAALAVTLLTLAFF